MKNIKNFLHVLLLQGGNYLFPLVTIPIASRVFGPDLIGTFNYYTYIVSFYCMIVEFGFGYSGVRLLTRNPENKSKIFNEILTAKFLILFLVSLFALFYSYKFISQSDFILFGTCYLLVLSSLCNVNWFFQATGDFSLITKVSLFTKFISILLIVFFVKNKDDLLLYSLIVNIPMVLSS
ncbi:TPA: oligosaccharide flippase family protein, partial [Klebsiella pneumoniae]|nr:oligosaccharide flippase family protein [Klebsiella pneumoniae]